MDRAYSTLIVKSINEDQGLIEGIASTPSTDRDGDVMVPEGAEFVLPLPLLLHHDHKQPIGLVTHATVTAAGIRVRAKIERELGGRIEEAWQLLKRGLVRGLSIGFTGSDSDPLPRGGRRFKRWQWLELSAVTVPANADATIRVIKSFDDAARTGTKPRLRPSDLVPAPYHAHDEASGIEALMQALQRNPLEADTALMQKFARLPQFGGDDFALAEAAALTAKAATARTQAESVAAMHHAVLALIGWREEKLLRRIEALEDLL